jgi:quinol monooxygenase YgiN
MDTTDIVKFQNRNNKSIRILVFFEAKRGRGKDLEKILLKVIGPTRKESGNIAYVLHRSNDNPDELLFDEIWTNKEVLEEHFKRPYIEDLDSSIEQSLARKLNQKNIRK